MNYKKLLNVNTQKIKNSKNNENMNFHEKIIPPLYMILSNLCIGI